MEVKVDTLINQIKDQGIAEAKKEAEIILDNAKREAEKIVSDAKRETEKLLSDAEKTNAANKQSTLSSLEHAKRDVLLDLKSEIDKLFNNELKKEVKSSLTSRDFTDTLGTLLTNELKNISVEYNPKDFDKVKGYVQNKLIERLIKEKKITINSDVIDGFAIKQKDNNYYIDCSSEEVSALLISYMKESK